MFARGSLSVVGLSDISVDDRGADIGLEVGLGALLSSRGGCVCCSSTTGDCLSLGIVQTGGSVSTWSGMSTVAGMYFRKKRRFRVVSRLVPSTYRHSCYKA